MITNFFILGSFFILFPANLSTVVTSPATSQNWIHGAGLAVLVLLLVALLYRFRRFERRVLAWLEKLPIPFTLASDQGLYEQFVRLADALADLARQTDPLLRGLAVLKLESIGEEVQGLAQGTLVFSATETWRTAYQKLLETLEERVYYSVAWVRSSDYWNDPPGRQSMKLNYELVGRGFRIERIHILPDELWRFEEPGPTQEICPWLEEQHNRGISVSLVRESDLANEPDLLLDFAIYGQRATAVQELDDRSRTVRYVLSFYPATIRQAYARWERLSLYAVSFEKGLDHRYPA